MAKQIVYPKYDLTKLEELTKSHLGEHRRFGAAKKPLVINSLNAVTGEPVCFKTRHHEDFKRDHQLPAWHVAVATAAAPVYMRAFLTEGQCDHMDGGIWANCPALVGAIEAINRFDRPRDSIDILNVGTTRAAFTSGQASRSGGALVNLNMLNPVLLATMMEVNRCAAIFMAKQLVGPDSLVEIDRVMGKATELDDTRPNALRDLEGLGKESAKAHVDSIDKRFLATVTPDFVPVTP